jgi:hypothetical protein
MDEAALGLLGPYGITVRDTAGRVLYPAWDIPRGLAILGTARRLLDQSRRPAAQIAAGLLGELERIRVYFLFRGEHPLELHVRTPRLQRVLVQPKQDDRAFRKSLADWWESLGEWNRPLMPGLPEQPLLGEFMPYVQVMLSHRLGLPLKDYPKQAAEEWIGWVEENERVFSRGTVGEMLFAAWGDRSRFRPQLATVAVPEGASFHSAGSGRGAGGVEPLASRVPRQCLYIRFGNYGNFVWFQDFLGRLGGDWEHLLRLRRWESSVAGAIEKALAVEQSLMARVMGPVVVEDVALLLGDLDFAGGGTFALLFKARNDQLLRADLERQRSQRKTRDPGLRETKLTIAGREVSLLRSDDGTTSSYYVAEDGFHLLSRSRRLVELFLQTRDQGGSLAESADFRHIRSKCPPTEADRVFLYADPSFWEFFLGPAVRIEMMRRWQALADIRMLQLARLSARAEGTRAETIGELVEAGFLPPDFGPRADGSHPLLVGEEVGDSCRGRPGAFLPIWDNLPQFVTAAEWEAYQRFVSRVRKSIWLGRPLSIALRWQPPVDAESQQESIGFEILCQGAGEIQLFNQRLGLPCEDQVRPLPEDGLFGELVLESGRFFWGVRQIRFPWDLGGQIGWQDVLKLREWVVGYWGEIFEGPSLGGAGGLPRSRGRQEPRGLFGRLRQAGPEEPRDPRIFADRFGLWTAEGEDFRASSFHSELLVELLKNWTREPAAAPAQFRLYVADLSGRPADTGFRRLAYARGVAAAANYVRLLQVLEEFFHLPPGQAEAVVQTLFHAKGACPLGGRYVWLEDLGGWSCTALAGKEAFPWKGEVPANFQAPPLNWFRGLELSLRSEAGDVWISGRVGMKLAGQ